MQMSGNSDAIREARLTAQDISERFRAAEQWAGVKRLRLLPGKSRSGRYRLAETTLGLACVCC